MSTHGQTALEHFLLGSVSEKVVRHVRCPVLTAKAFGRSLVARNEA
jgi:nucleotide-binding universal stress UspA family protein